MKIIANEYDHAFEISIDAETVAEAALLARIGLNAVRRSITVDTTAYGDGTVTTAIWAIKRKNSTGRIA